MCMGVTGTGGVGNFLPFFSFSSPFSPLTSFSFSLLFLFLLSLSFCTSSWGVLAWGVVVPIRFVPWLCKVVVVVVVVEVGGGV